MGSVTIQSHTTEKPITMIGQQAGVCWDKDIYTQENNFLRGMDCLGAKHGRTFEFPDVYLILDGYSARVIREWYTHIGGSPTRLQSSTRYIQYQKGFDYIIPPSIDKVEKAEKIYTSVMNNILQGMNELSELDIPREDIAMCLPLGMTTKIVAKHNLRNLLDMAQQRKCKRAYWEYRELFKDIEKALSDYSYEWEYLVNTYFKCKCDILGRCEEKYGCGKYPK